MACLRHFWLTKIRMNGIFFIHSLSSSNKLNLLAHILCFLSSERDGWYLHISSVGGWEFTCVTYTTKACFKTRPDSSSGHRAHVLMKRFKFALNYLHSDIMYYDRNHKGSFQFLLRPQNNRVPHLQCLPIFIYSLHYLAPIFQFISEVVT